MLARARQAASVAQPARSARRRAEVGGTSGRALARPQLAGPAARAGRLVAALGGRYSTQVGIDVDGGDAEVERWFVAATLSGTRISATVAQRTFHVLEGAGLSRIADAGRVPWDDLVALLDAGGYARYDLRTATRLHALSQVVNEVYGGAAAALGRRFPTYPALRDALDRLPGWGPVTLQLFLRELRGVWPGAQPPLDERARDAARHLGFIGPHGGPGGLETLRALCADAQLDIRDLESGLVRLALAHRRRAGACAGGDACVLLPTAADPVTGPTSS